MGRQDKKLERKGKQTNTEEQANEKINKHELPRPGRVVKRQPFPNTPSRSRSRSPIPYLLSPIPYPLPLSPSPSPSLMPYSLPLPFPDLLNPFWNFLQIPCGGTTQTDRFRVGGGPLSTARDSVIRKAIHSSGGPGSAVGLPDFFLTRNLPVKLQHLLKSKHWWVRWLVVTPLPLSHGSAPSSTPPTPFTLPPHPLPPYLTKITERFQTKDVLCLGEGGEKAKFIIKACCL